MESERHEITTGRYSGGACCARDDLEPLVRELGAILDGKNPGEHVRGGSGGMTRHTITLDGGELELVVKGFRRQWWRDGHFRRVGSKARMSFEIAAHLHEHGVGTPRPVAWLDHWHEGRLLESRFAYEYEPGTSFRAEVDRVMAGLPVAREVLPLLQAVAAAIARMHAAGVCHFDLGNQNVLVDRVAAGGWRNVRFIDLDRSRRVDAPSLRVRARDLSRIDLPSALLPIFHSMYFGDRLPPEEFVRWESHYRRRFALHTATRGLRHPVRALRNRTAAHGAELRARPDWMWDDLSEQAIGIRTKRDRYTAYPWRNGLHIVRGLARSALPVKRRYRELMSQAFSREVTLQGRIGMGAGGLGGMREAEHELLAQLGSVPILVRLHRHASDLDNGRVLEHARRARAAGHRVFVALLQDRAGVDSPAAWSEFVQRWLPPAAQLADAVEVGHAVNRVKWGVYRFSDYRRMVDAVLALKADMPNVRLTGPAVIDFEYHFLVGLLDALPGNCFDAVSHHLYVDRRGAPENRQSGFSSIEKFALAKAIAACSPAVDGDRLVISEVNWPLRGTGVYSPVNAPYIPRDHEEPHCAVDEDTYASFMLRYYVLALCSGFVEQVYWWRLAAHGFGIVDDKPEVWRPRPAFKALQRFVALLGDSTFLGRLPAPTGVWALRFRKPDSSRVVMAWAHPSPVSYEPGFTSTAVLSRDGEEIAGRAASVLGGDPVYFIGVANDG